MKFIKYIFLSLFLLSLLPISSSKALAVNNLAPNSSKVEYVKAKIISVSNAGKNQNVSAQISEGKDANKTLKINYDPQGLSSLSLKSGENVVLSKFADSSGKAEYSINDRYRLPFVGLFLTLFLGLIILIAGKKGVGSIVGLAISLAIIFLYVVPQILSGHDPLFAAISGSILILLSTTYIAHGFSRQTTIALISTLSALILTWIIATFVLKFSLLSGFGTEEAYDLHLGLKSLVDFRGLLLGGIIIATLGALNDVTTTQAATIFEIHKSNTKLDFDELLRKGLSVGREHVVSLVNTLVLAFVGTSLALFLIYFFNPNHEPLWVILNSEIISEEIIKTIVGTAGLLLSMPIVTILATFVCIDILGEKHK